MLTPQEVANKSFTKSMMGGYSMPMVDEFLDELTEDYTSLYKENAALKAKLKVLVEKVEEYRATEESMRAALFSAQKMASSIVEEAQSRSANIVAAAEAETKEEIARIRQGVAEEQRRLEAAKAETAAFVAQWKAVCEREAAFLQRLPELDVSAAPAAEQPPREEGGTAPSAEDAALEETILNVMREAEKSESPAPAESAAEEPPAPEAPKEERVPSAEDVAGMFETRTFRLDELQFGRNYGGEKK
ncbi:MAG: DivIVA domain-containing protein [Oscillospiraceae bacterium]